MRHLTLQQLSATVDQALSGVSLELVRRHLEECEECRGRGSKLARVDGVVAQLVSHDPGDAWLEAVAVEIDERVRAEVAGRFDPPAHPAGPPPLEFVAAPAPLTPDQLDAIWEEGSTTPRPSSLRPREGASAENAAASESAPPPPHFAPSPPGVPPVVTSAPTGARPVEKPIPVAKAGPVEKPAPPVKAASVERSAPAAKSTPAEQPAPVAKAVPVDLPAPAAKSAPAEQPAPVAKPAPVEQPAPLARAPVEQPATPAVKAPPLPRPRPQGALAPHARTRVPSYASDEADGTPPKRWGRHADRVVRARREPSSTPRETLVPIAFGLVGGALAGALVVTLFFLQHGGAGGAPAAAVTRVARTTEPAAAIVDPVPHPAVEPAPVGEAPNAESGPAPPESAPVTLATATTPPAPAKSRATVPAPATVPARTTQPHTEPAVAGRAIPTGEESWPLLCGDVVDESGAPVTGARILLADLDVGARTDRRGRFCLAAPPGDRTLSVVALGFATQRRAVSVANGAADVHVVLKAAP